LRPVLDPAAFAELREAAKFYEESRKGLGLDFLESVETAFDSIMRHPTLWRRLKGRFRRCLVHGFPYGVIYAVEDDTVYVAAVMHLRREPGYWERRQG
jgi:toxin ParE1/3/4